MVQPVRADDVRWTFHEMLMRPEVKADRLRTLVGGVIDRVSAIDERTVEFSFKSPNYANIEMALTLPVLPARFYSGFEAL
jgi:ABC-type transport system substrate-binding protein